MIVDRHGRDKGRTDPQSRDHETGLSRDQADALLTDVHSPARRQIVPVRLGAGPECLKSARVRVSG